jgi:hypothetical protein
MANSQNLRPFQKGYQPENRASKAKYKALYAGKCASPEAVEFCINVMRDPEAPLRERLRASENILKVAFPAKGIIQTDPEHVLPGDRYLQVIFVRPGEAPASIEARPTGNGTFAVSIDGD